ncbi:type I-E CRISPR-associated endonuclease Cas1e [Candidatus Synechococcus calcipolaris G9]|uniref:CRISPR-associated endonuclease Cas1 n=1 Tax=Candidatus Synechococcus calcipolaris G9 TaxID=1497997 RepID=A0ABT6F118_9SYNE|nr:type I-E CRISPR-associated endonuclease Cas1e [Candidatus Synechococcus calcipolaris]MDG2991556.1 type I-E CRISPR-associated endonuclease Cas1e [Candidatus Synechococcus calcipolaris G9]
MKNLRTLPKNRDRISFIYFEHCRIEQDQQAIVIFKEDSKYLIPCAAIATLLLGPGTSITHAAIKALADNTCNIQWVGENLSRFYAHGRSGANNTNRLLHQVSLWADSIQRLAVVRRMYMFRFQEPLSEDLSLQQIRGHEGVRVRTLYQRWSKETGIEWTGRDYKQSDWNAADPINKALSIANAYLYAVCQAAIQSVGYSPALGFIHTGKPLSFVYDVADLYKGETTIPAAFEATAEARPSEFDSIIRRKCRDRFTSYRLMPRLVHDIDSVLGFGSSDDSEPLCLLWDDVLDSVEGGKNWSIPEG